MRISVVINTYNEEKNIRRAIESVKWADEVVVCDMYSDDDTAVIAKKCGAVLMFTKKVSHVEPVRNLPISKAIGDWILVLDADEEISDTLAKKLKDIANNDGVVSYVEIARKNMIFGKWVKGSNWWPDAHIRFFRKGAVIWNDEIHSKPKTTGQGLTLPAVEELAIIHHHYVSVVQYMDRLNRYSSVQAKELVGGGYKFDWKDLIKAPVSEFLGRYFANKGYNDGVHGLGLALLQAFSFVVVYIKIWELEGFKEKQIDFKDLKVEIKDAGKEIDYWLKYGNLSKNPLKRFVQRVANKL